MQGRILFELGSPMVFVCSFGHEVMPDDLAVELEDRHVSTLVCPRCLVLITVHRRYHRMKVEKVIHNMVEQTPS